METRKAKPAPATSNRHGRYLSMLTVAMSIFIAAVIFVSASCQRKAVLSHARFLHLPATGWLRSLPLSFTPEFDDSTTTYRISLAVRHDNAYAYSNLSLAVDLVNDGKAVTRHEVDMTLADEYGNWTGGGFGTLYQNTHCVARGLSPADAENVVVWQTMTGCDTLRGIADIGIIVTPE